jgi:hypothetical protein
MYTTPLMGFIDEACVVFDGEEENKFEHTTIHEKFKELVERLLTDFLSEMGISVDQFSEVIQRSEHADLNEFVLASILTVDDFLHFKSMMVRRNVDLTNEVLEAHNKGKARERNARAIAIQESPSRGTRGGPVTDAAPGSGPTTPDPPPPAALVRHADPGTDDDGFHLGAVEQALKASKEQHERDERERRRLDRLAASEEAAQEAMAMRESAALAAQVQGGTMNDADAADDVPPSPTSSEGSLTDDADALAAAIQASEKSTVTDEERRAEMDSYAIVEEKRKALAEALAELKAAEDAAKEVKIACGTPKPKRVSVASMFHGAKIPAMEELRRRRDEFYARRKAAREAYAEEAHRNAEATQQRMAALVAAREAEAKAEEDAVRARDEEEAERVRRIESEEDAELRAALEASAAEDAAKQSALSSAEAQEAAEMEAAIAASLAADVEAKKIADAIARKEAEELAEAERVNAIELEKAEYAAATKSSDVYDGASSNGSDAETENAVHPKTIENNLGRKPLGGGSGQVVKLPAIGKTGLPPVGRLPKISAGGTGQGSGSGFRSAGYIAPTSVDFTPAVNSLSVREAAAAAAASQKNMLKEPEDEGSPEVSAAETKAFIDEQRRVLVAKKNAEREQELQEWNVSNMNPLFDESSRPSTAASVRMRPMAAPVETNSAGLTEEEQAAKREALRLELAKKMKEDLTAKRMGTVQAWGEPGEQLV